MTLVEAQLNSRYRSQAFPCASCGRLVLPRPAMRRIGIVLVFMPVVLFWLALLFGGAAAIVASLVFALPWSLLVVWLMPYYTPLDAAERPGDLGEA